MQTPTIGRIVHYVLNEGRNAGEERPAIIVRTWGDTPESCVQLQVFTDSGTAGKLNDFLPPVMWKTSVVQDDGKAPGTFHFPEVSAR